MKKPKFNKNYISHHSFHDWGESIFILEKSGNAICRIYWSYNEDVKTVFICDIDVDKKSRNQGIGTYFMNVFETFAKENGINKCCLWVKDNTWQRKWYERLGYVYSGDYDEINVWLCKNIDET